MTTINAVDFRQVSRDAVNAARDVVLDVNAWKELKDIVRNVSDSLAADVCLIAKRKLTGEFNEDDARVFLEDQKMVARIRIRSVAIIGPSSAAIPEPTRPATISPVSTGTSSLTIEALTSRPTIERAPNWSRVNPDWSARTIPVNIPVSSTTVSEPRPIASNCWITAR